MNLPFVNLAILIATSAILCGAMSLGWLYFGRLRYAQLWALSAAASLAQWSFNTFSRSAFPGETWPLIITGLLVVIGGTLVASGARNRAGLPMRTGWLVGLGLAATAVMIWSWATNMMSVRGFVANAHAALMMMIAAAAMHPRRRAANPPELAIISVFLAFGLFEVWLAVLSLGMGADGMTAEAAIYRNVLSIGLPATYAGLGVAAIFVLAMDLNDRLRALATRDAASGTLNRRGLEQAALVAFADARRRDRPLAIVICAINGYDDMRRVLSFAEVDRILAFAADLIYSNVREEDLVGRIGMTEFCLLLTDSTLVEAHRKIEQIRAEIAETPSGLRLFSRLTMSVGMTEFKPDDVLFNDVLARAFANLRDPRTGKSTAT
jgi:diguanylate cyclase (GGDEF)-like protein